MEKYFLASFLFIMTLGYMQAQNAKGITLEEYAKAKTFTIKDLDNDTYVKFDNNKYVLDRYEGRKPYIITGNDSLKKRIDLYSLLNKADQKELGTVIYYTNENGKLYTVCLPNAFADKKVWETYFEDIHAIDKEESDFVLKLSYVLSKEYSYQSYKSSLKGKEIDRSEAATYGTDICFPGDGEVTLANGKKKAIKEIQPGDEIVTADPTTHSTSLVKVKQLIAHDAKNYAITQLLLISAKEQVTNRGYEIRLHKKELEATPNHPMMTRKGVKKIGSIKEGEEIFCFNEQTEKYELFIVWDKSEKAQGVQKVYNIDAAGGRTLIVNGVVVLQK